MAFSWNFSVAVQQNNASSLPLSTIFNQVFTQYNATLFPDSCGPSRNCTAACLNISQVFNDTRLTQNCFLYPFVGSLMASNNLLTPVLTAAHSMGIVSDLRTCSAVANITQQCLLDYSAYLYEHSSTVTSFYRSAAKINGQTLYYPDICVLAVESINPDIGGIGVYYSYWAQSILSIAFFIFMKLSTSWGFWIARASGMIFSCSMGSGKAIESARDAQKKMKKHLDSLVTAMINFQKAQCFFVLALETATLIILTSASRMIATFGNFFIPFLSAQWDLMSAVSMGGMVPVTFTLLTIHIADHRSSFLLFLTIITVVVSVTTYVLLLHRSSTQSDTGSISGLPPSCGIVDPARFCASDFSDLKKPTFWKSPGATSMCISITTLVLLIIDHFVHTFQPSLKKLRKRTDDPWDLSFKRLAWRDRRTNEAIQCLCLIMWTFSCAAYIWAFTQIFKTLSISNPSSSPSPGGFQGLTWTFGQIVAITVWIPSVIELFYLLHHGMEKGIQYRITRNFRLIRVIASHNSEEEIHRTGYSIVSTFLQQPWVFIEAYRQHGKDNSLNSRAGALNSPPLIVQIDQFELDETQAPHRRRIWHSTSSPGRCPSVEDPKTPPESIPEQSSWRPLSLHLDEEPLLPPAHHSPHLRSDSAAGLGLVRHNSQGSNSGIYGSHLS